MRYATSYLVGAEPAPDAHQVDPLGRLERPDEHRGADPLALADRVEQRVDSVGPVHVGGPGCTEQGRGAPRHPDVGVAGRLGLVVGLGLDDDPGGLAVGQDTADEVAGDLDDRPAVEPRAERPGHPSPGSSSRSSAARARCSCSRTRAGAVPPSETLLCSQAPSDSTR